jgi:hypothetical protein
LRQGDWKAVRYGVMRDPDAPTQLYHLPMDIGETRDVAAEYPDIVERMRRLMQEAHVPSDQFAF